ncbi:hypothetical protein JZU68_02795, partial [bacterium]|nr:hypothetical protein [bacterium]
MKVSRSFQSILIALTFSLSLMALDTPKFYLRGHLQILRRDGGTTETRSAKFNALFPESIRKNVVYTLWANAAWYYTQKVSDYTSFTDDNYFELCKRMDSLNVAYVVNVGEPTRDPLPMPEPPLLVGNSGYYLTPAQVDRIFTNMKNCVGISSGENFWNYSSSISNAVIELLRVCKKHNKKYILGEGGWAYSAYARFLNENYAVLKNEELGKYLIPVFKNTKPYAAFVTQSAIMGAWATGLTEEYGTWNDEWAWTYSSFKQANEFPIYTKADNTYTLIPFTHYLKSWLLTIAAGGNSGYMETAFFDRAGNADANQAPYWLPFFKGLAEHNIMPSKTAVLAKVKAIANPYGTYTLSDGTTAPYTISNLVTYQSDLVVSYKPFTTATYVEPYGRFYKNTYGIWNDTAYTNV